jgi:hypothetical protein
VVAFPVWALSLIAAISSLEIAGRRQVFSNCHCPADKTISRVAQPSRFSSTFTNFIRVVMPF